MKTSARAIASEHSVPITISSKHIARTAPMLRLSASPVITQSTIFPVQKFDVSIDLRFSICQAVLMSGLCGRAHYGWSVWLIVLTSTIIWCNCQRQKPISAPSYCRVWPLFSSRGQGSRCRSKRGKRKRALTYFWNILFSVCFHYHL